MELLRIAVFLAIAAAALGSTSDSTTETTLTTPTTSSLAPTTTVQTTIVTPTSTPKETTAATEASTAAVTTAKPVVTTATEPAPTTSAAPEPEIPKQMSFILKKSTGENCVELSVALDFTLTYMTDAGTNETSTVILKDWSLFNATVSSDSHCSLDNETIQSFGIVWGDNSTTGEPAPFEVVFWMINTEDGGFTLQNVSLTVTYTDTSFPHHEKQTTPRILNSTDLSSTYKTAKSYSYKCSHPETISLGDDNKIDVSNFQFQAFASGQGFYTAQNCPDDYTTSDVVPIAVGCALAALVIIVLIAYLIGRKRSRQKGYQSV